MIVPLGMTVLLSFHDWGQYKGIVPVFTLKNWHRGSAPIRYFLEIFMRTFRIAFFVTLLGDRDRRARGLHPQPHVAALAQRSSCW